ncbi:acyl-CoA synthetase/AMP-acid ligase-like protein II [Choiromyces venosus 120613-1]|uniref:Acyl-CoA synthetase/AMP-acid ligase-like protein II n=1 Tax=Choiromyces venosus 120613-1 TaxID=1336337 RepID=A0A3N4JC06_9PEZI|nr:acyl-CoA synthetase/AMP-acid ligase-like protein II [Choiromyces venosus 120613-1]
MWFRLWLRSSALRYRTAGVRAGVAKRTLLTGSHYKGPTEPPLLELTTGAHLAEITSQYGDSLAVISSHQNTRLTYSALHTQSTSLAHGLKNLGVQRGDRVAVSLGNNIEFALATYATFKLGAVLVPLNPSFNTLQVASALKHLDATHLLIGLETNLPRRPPRSNDGLLRELVPGCEGAGAIASELVPSLRRVVVVDNTKGRGGGERYKAFSKFPDVLEDGEGKAHLSEEGMGIDDVVNIQFTSGTTSVPKAACLTHRSILNNGKGIGDRMLLTHKDVICCPPPFCFGSVLGYMASATHGSCIVFPTECFDAKATLHAVQQEKCTALYGVPTMFTAELELLARGEVEQKGFEHIRTGIAAGSSIPKELMKKLHRKLNLTELSICYGMTETSPVSAMTTTDDPLEKRVGSVGRLMPHVEAKVVSASDRTKILPIGKRGELAVSGYLLQKGYWNDPIRTAEVMVKDENGKLWMRTGDEAEMDENGYIKITGRLKDLIIRGGENIHPLEIENCLLGHSRILESSVVGLKDERYGEVVVAFVRREEGLTPNEVREWVREKLSHHLVPKYVFWVDGYPKTASGKIQKFVLQEMGAKLVAKGEGL